ncbi:MAG: amidohydrolase family protein, partial [Hyphomicrobiaceae bacterium]
MTPLLDSHQHLLHCNHFGYAWTKALPALEGKDFTIDAYKALTKGLNVEGTIFMEADAGDQFRDETRLVAKLAGDPQNGIVGIISSCRPETNRGFEPWLDEATSLPVVGFRRILHEVDNDVSRTETFRQNVGRIGDRGFVFDMVFRADQLPIAAELAQECDNTKFVLDHCGVPDVAEGDFASWRAGLSDVASLPHVSCKISGILAYCAPGAATIDEIRPYVDHAFEAFGPERLLWGSDWPVVNLRSSLPEWISIFR